MDTLDDAYGHIIWNAFNGLTSFDVVERDDGYINVSGYEKIYLAEYNQWDKCEKESIRFAKGKCLDIGCGAGRVPLYLQKKGIYCLGIDNSPLAIKTCQTRGVVNTKISGLEQINLFRNNYFNSIIMFGNNFSLLSNVKKAKRLLRTMHKITTEDGLIIAGNRDPYITDNPFHLIYHKANRKKGRLPGQLRVRVRFMQYSTGWFDLLYVSKKEMKEILNGTGWKVYKFINSQEFAKNGLYTAIIKKEPKKE